MIIYQLCLQLNYTGCTLNIESTISNYLSHTIKLGWAATKQCHLLPTTLRTPNSCVVII